MPGGQCAGVAAAGWIEGTLWCVCCGGCVVFVCGPLQAQAYAVVLGLAIVVLIALIICCVREIHNKPKADDVAKKYTAGAGAGSSPGVKPPAKAGGDSMVAAVDPFRSSKARTPSVTKPGTRPSHGAVNGTPLLPGLVNVEMVPLKGATSPVLSSSDVGPDSPALVTLVSAAPQQRGAGAHAGHGAGVGTTGASFESGSGGTPGLHPSTPPETAEGSGGTPPLWRELLDESTGAYYYYNTSTLETTWVKPSSLS